MTHADQKIRHMIGDLLIANAVLEQQLIELQAKLAAAAEPARGPHPPSNENPEPPRS